jgi:hypothetical protein
MNNNFIKFNVLDSKNLSDVQHISKLEAKDKVIADTGTTTFDFYSIDDLKYAPDWPHTPFTYVVNQHGFRFEEIPAETDLAVFGCSFTFGLGLPNEMLWHNILAKELNISCLNFGMCGSSIKSIIDVFLIVSKHIKIKKAIFLLPSIERSQVAKTHPLQDRVDYLTAMPNQPSQLCNAYSIDTTKYFKYMPEEELQKDALEAIYLSEYVAQHRGIDAYYGSWDPNTFALIKAVEFKNGVLLPQWWTPVEFSDDKARDKMHPGPRHNKYWASEIKPFIK